MRKAASAAEVMAIPKRRKQLPGTYFITSRTWESRTLFTKEPVCRIFVETLHHYRAARIYQLYAFVLMPEHFHVLLAPGASSSLERAVQHVKGGLARKIGQLLNLRFPVWQRGFSDYRIRDAKDYEAHVRTIEQNPVKRKLVAAASEYPWSSLGRGLDLDVPPQGLKPTPRA